LAICQALKIFSYSEVVMLQKNSKANIGKWHEVKTSNERSRERDKMNILFLSKALPFPMFAGNIWCICSVA